MSIEIKKSTKPVKYLDALRFMEQRLLDINSKKSKVWLQAQNRVDVQKSILLYCFDKLR